MNVYSDMDYDSLYNEIKNGPYNEKYYNDEQCNEENNNIINNNCKNDYDNSYVKTIIDKWVKDNNIEKDLIEVDGYKSRLLNSEDLFDNLNYTGEQYKDYSGTRNIYVNNAEVPEWIYNKGVNYWTMINNGLHQTFENNLIYILSKNGYLGTLYFNDKNNLVKANVYDKYAIRPVLNLNKCAIEGGCTTEEIEIEDGCIEDETTILENVPSTLSYISKIIIGISLIFIIIGCGVLGYNYYNSRKERK